MTREDCETCTTNWRSTIGVAASELLSSTEQSLAGALSGLGDLVRRTSATKLMLVVDRQAVAATHAQPTIDAQLGGFECCWFDGFNPNPRCEEGLAAARLAVARSVDAVVAVGGGSCLDVAKIAALAARRMEIAESLARGERLDEAEPLPIIAVPTTSGTGSEATHFAAIYVDGRKASVAHPRLRPRGVVLDPALHLAMPARIAAETGLDALGQAMESLWAVGSTERSRAFATAGGRLVAQYLEESVKRPTPERRLAMMVGAHLAGQAINISKTTASHAMSYKLTQRFGVAHGHGVALTLGHVAAANAAVTAEDCADPRGPEHVREQVRAAAALLDATPADLPRAVGQLLDRLGLPATLEGVGVDPASAANLAKEVDPVRLGNNPRRFTRAGLAGLLRDACGVGRRSDQAS